MKKTPKLRLHAIVPYDRGGKVRWLLEEIGVEFETRWLDRETAEHEQPEFLKLNPMGRVPVLEIDGRPMFESGAICAYLADLFGERAGTPRTDAPERATYEQWMYFAAATLDVFQTRIMIIEDIPPGEVQAAKQSALLSELRDALETLNLTLAKGDYLVGGRFTAADIGVSYHLTWCRLWHELDVVFVEFPKIIAYLERMHAMPSAVKSGVFSYPG